MEVITVCVVCGMVIWRKSASSFDSPETILLAAPTSFDEHDDRDVYNSD